MDFERALALDPNHANANAYLSKTRAVHERLILERESAHKGEFLLSSDFEPAKTPIHEIKRPPKMTTASELNTLIADDHNDALYDLYMNSSSSKKHKKKHKKSEKSDRKRRYSRSTSPSRSRQKSSESRF